MKGKKRNGGVTSKSQEKNFWVPEEKADRSVMQAGVAGRPHELGAVGRQKIPFLGEQKPTTNTSHAEKKTAVRRKKKKSACNNCTIGDRQTRAGRHINRWPRHSPPNRWRAT